MTKSKQRLSLSAFGLLKSFVGGTESLIVTSAEALDKLGKRTILFISRSIFRCLGDLWANICHYFVIVTATQENSSRRLVSNIDVPKS